MWYNSILKRRSLSCKGFTLIELVVVIAIMAILASVATVSIIAAYNSRARDSALVPVDYTIIKNVKKPPGARPGRVIYSDFKTAVVTPSRELSESLRVE